MNNKKGIWALIVRFVIIVTFVNSTSLSWAIDSNTLPTSGQIVSGQGSISQSGNTMTVNQNTDSMIANWSTFNIGKDALVNFVQPGASSIALNRIQDSQPSQILGRLSANGQVFLLNTNGIIFGQGAQVDVAGLVASSLNLSNEDFLAKKFNFSNLGFAGDILNQGNIQTADGGYVAFISPVVKNEGQIISNSGGVFLASGDKVNLDFTGDKLVNFTVDQGTVNSLIENKGLVKVDNGTVIMTAKAADALTQSVINNSGVIEAKGITQKGGRIVLSADKISVNSGARLDASGATGGGEILVGGGWQGKDATIANAKQVDVDNTVTVDASAIDNGDGGKIVFWSDDKTMFEGNIFARGGINGGNGGQVEVSGKKDLGYMGLTDTRAPLGKMGNLLLDPTSINIKNGAGANTASVFYEENLEAQMTNIDLQTDANASGAITLENLADNLLLLQTDVNLNMRSGNYFSGGYGSITTSDVNDEIRVSGTGQITMQSGMSISCGKLTATGTGKIRLYGDNGLTVGNTLTTNGGIIELWADSDDLTGGSLTLSQALNSNGGNVYLDSGSSGITINGNINTGAGRIFFDTFGSALGYNITLNSKITSTGDVTINKSLRFGTGAELETTGVITLANTTQMLNSGSNLTLTGSTFDFQQTVTGNSATINLKPATVGANIDIGAAASGDLSITAASLTNLSNFANIIVGRSDGTGTTVVTSDLSVALPGRFELINDTINVTGGTLTNTSGSITLTGNVLDISKAINAGTNTVTIQQQTAANTLVVGTEPAIGELAYITAGTLTLGRSDGGALTIAEDLTTSATNVHLKSGSTVTANAGGVTATGVAVTAGGAVSMTDTNNSFSNLAVSAAGQTVTINNAIATNITTVGGVVGLTAGTLNLTSNGAITDAQALTVTGTATLAAGASNNITLDVASNNFGTVIVTNGNNISLLDSNTLTLGAITAAGTIYAATTTGDLTLSGNIETSDTSTSALKLNAGKGTAAGTTTGGNIVFSGSPTITLGSGGRAVFYIGSISGSPDIIALVGSGSGKFRYNSNESTTNYDTALGASGNYAVLRQSPSAITITANDETKSMSGSYSGGNGVTSSGFVNGDTIAQLGGAISYGGTSQGADESGTYTIVPSGYTRGVGYTISYVAGELTLTIVAGNSTIDVVKTGVNSFQEAVNGTQQNTYVLGGDPMVLPIGPGMGSITMTNWFNTSLVSQLFGVPLDLNGGKK